MKKILCIALFSIAIMANATEKKEIVTKTKIEKEVVTDNSNKIMVNNFKEIKTVNNKCTNETSENDMLFGCGSDGNDYYDTLISDGMSHRDARRERRAFVRECRGFGDEGWIGDLLWGGGATFTIN
jgi:hypothetical protein